MNLVFQGRSSAGTVRLTWRVLVMSYEYLWGETACHSLHPREVEVLGQVDLVKHALQPASQFSTLKTGTYFAS